MVARKLLYPALPRIEKAERTQNRYEREKYLALAQEAKKVPVRGGRLAMGNDASQPEKAGPAEASPAL